LERRGPVIAVSGPPGSGKTTYAKRLAEDLNLSYHSAGSIFRSLASRLGVSLEELSVIAEKDPRIDLEIDRKTLELAERGGVVIEGHLVACILAHIADVLIYVKAPLHVRIERIAERDGRNRGSAMEEVVVRELSHAIRFRSYYGFNVADLSIFDLVIDTSTLGVDEVYDVVLRLTCYKLLRRGFRIKRCLELTGKA
jgi:cytidylate kinase